MEAIATKLTPVQYAEKAREGLTRKKEERQERFIDLYNARQSLGEILGSVGIGYTAFYKWLEEPDFKAEYEQKRKEVLSVELTEVEDIMIKAAKGDVYATTRYYKTTIDDKTGEVVETPSGKAVHQQPPSFKHGEMMLKAHKPKLYGSNDQGATGQVTINLNVTGGTDSSLEIKAIDVTDIRRLESNALNGGVSPDNHIE